MPWRPPLVAPLLLSKIDLFQTKSAICGGSKLRGGEYLVELRWAQWVGLVVLGTRQSLGNRA